MLYNYRKQIIAITLIIIVSIVSLVYYSYVNSFQFLTVTYNQKEAQMKLYEGGDEQSSSHKELRDIPSGQKIKIKKGQYFIQADSQTIAPFKEALLLDGTPVIKSITYQFSGKYLASLLKTEKTTVMSVITTAYPQISALYNVSREKLYNRGDFYGETLTYKGKDSNNRDSLRVLLQKEDGQWKLLTKPPQPLLNSHDFPQVPKSILSDIDRYSILPGAANSPTIDEDSKTEYNY